MTMKSTTLMLVLLSLLSLSHGFDIENISKVLCFLYGEVKGWGVDILNTRVIRLVDLNKILYEKCDLRTRIISSNTANFNKLIAFATEETIEAIQDLVNRNEEAYLFGIIFFDKHEVMMSLPTKINQEILFINSNTWDIYEHYSINGNNVATPIAFFNSSIDVKQKIRYENQNQKKRKQFNAKAVSK